METIIQVNDRAKDDIMIFEFIGELDETNSDKTFGALYKKIGSFVGKKIIFNFSGLKYLNSKSIGYIADIFSNIEENNGKMFITNCLEGVKDILELVGITSIIPTVEKEEEAITQING
ncbi:MAG: STAS domain-containing protein [Candidatus Gracilibacteria bacterium]|nr:STAS domain-containing protein [Candidatus Gracilibacteria bacterium]